MERQFYSSDVLKILRNKFVIIIGDSIQRGIYKDLVLLIQKDRYLTRSELKTKGEHSFLDDELVEGGKKDGMTNGTSYKEVRQFKTEHHHLRFYFVTRCYNVYVKSILIDLQEKPLPDIVVMNSCLWDVSRYGKNGMSDYRVNILSLFSELYTVLPKDCMMIWNTTLPVSKNARGGFLPPEEEFKHSILSADILQANIFTKYYAYLFKFKVLDLHAHLWNHGELQVDDGIHWDMVAHRFITNLIMEIVCENFGSLVPFRPAEFCVQRRPHLPHVEMPHPLFTQSRVISSEHTPLRPLRNRNRHRNRHRHRNRNRNERLQDFNSSLGIQSPLSDQSGYDFHSPVSYRSFDETKFDSPSIFQSPLDYRSPDHYPSAINMPRLQNFNPLHFESQNISQSPLLKEFLHSSVGNLGALQSSLDLQMRNLRENLNSLDRLASTGLHDRQDRSHYINHSNIPNSTSGGTSSFFNLGQYNNQGQQSGAIRHSGRCQRRRQPYYNDW